MATARDGSAKSFLQKAGKLTSKYAGRAHEKMLQRMGKAEEEKDELIQQHVNSFNTQHTTALRLQKEVHRYWDMLKAWNQASKALMFVASESYDSEWNGKEKFQQSSEHCSLLGEDLIETLKIQMLDQVDHYCGKFGEVRNQINKRERKLLDYNRAKRELEALKAKDKVNDLKIQKAEEGYEEAKKLYTEMNRKLHEDLPKFHDSRIVLYSALFQSYASTHVRFFEETIKLFSSVHEVMEELEKDAEQYATPRDLSSNADTGEVDATNSEDQVSTVSDGGSLHGSVPEGQDSSVPGTPTPKTSTEEGVSFRETSPPEITTTPPPSETSPNVTTPTGEEKSRSLKRPPPKPVRPDSFAPDSDVRGKPPSLSSIVGGIKPPPVAEDSKQQEVISEETEPSADKQPESPPSQESERPESLPNDPPLTEESGEPKSPPDNQMDSSSENTKPSEVRGDEGKEPAKVPSSETTTPTTTEEVGVHKEGTPETEFVDAIEQLPTDNNEDKPGFSEPGDRETPQTSTEPTKDVAKDETVTSEPPGEEGGKADTTADGQTDVPDITTADRQTDGDIPDQTESTDTPVSQTQPVVTGDSCGDPIKPAADTNPVQTEPVQTEPVQTEPVQTEPVQTEPVQTEPVQTEPVQTEPVQTEPVQTEPVRTEPVQTEPVRTEPVQTEPVQTEPVQTEPVQTEPVQTEPVQMESSQTTDESESDTVDGMKILYKVRVAHAYTGEDSDELTLEPNEIICVVPFPEDDEQVRGCAVIGIAFDLC
jgi:hypothetical protein